MEGDKPAGPQETADFKKTRHQKNYDAGLLSGFAQGGCDGERCVRGIIRVSAVDALKHEWGFQRKRREVV